MSLSDFSVLETFVHKKLIPENRMQNWLQSSCFDFITK